MFAYIKALIAGLLSIIVFHQGLLWGLNQLDIVEATPWSLASVGGFGMPVLAWLCIWGAVWGVVLWPLIRNAQSAGYYVGAVLLSAILPTLVAFSLVPLARGVSIDSLLAGLTLARIGVAMALNGAFGLGLALFMRVMHPPR